MTAKYILLMIVFFTQMLLAQKLPVVHIIPFEEAEGASSAQASKAYALFKAELSRSGRVSLFSAEAWQRIFTTESLILTINDFRDSEKAIKIGKLTPVDYIAVGQVSLQHEENALTIDWINLHTGLVEKSFSLNIDDPDQMENEIGRTVRQIIKSIVKEGRVLGQNNEGQVRLSLPRLSGWRSGDEFVLVNSLRYPYARVRLTSFDSNEALAEMLHLNDRLRKDDRAVLAENFTAPNAFRPRAYLWSISGPALKGRRQEMFLRARQLILDSGKFDLLDTPDSQPYFSFRFHIEEKPSSTIYLVHLSVKKYPGENIIYEKNQDCLAAEVEKTVNTLLAIALNRWEQVAQVTRISASSIMLNEGQNQHIRQGQRVFFKEPGSEGIIAQGTIAEVYANYSLAKVKDASALRAGCLAVFPQPSGNKNFWHAELQKIYTHAQKEKNRLQAEKKLRDEEMQKQEEERRLRERPKSRLRMGYTYLLFQADEDKQMFYANKTSQMDVDLYLGDHPYFNMVLNYSYAHLNLTEDRGFLYANTAGLGARLHIPLFGPFSIYGEALGQYSWFHNSAGAAVQRFSQEEWKSAYLCLRAGMDISLSSGLSLYLEGGQKRKLKTKVADLEYISASAGLAVWF